MAQATTAQPTKWAAMTLVMAAVSFACGGARVVHTADDRVPPATGVSIATTGTGTDTTTDAGTSSADGTATGIGTARSSSTVTGTASSTGTGTRTGVASATVTGTGVASGTATGTAAAPGLTPQAIAGHWVGACFDDSSVVQGQTIHAPKKYDLVYTGNALTGTETLYSDLACTQPLDDTIVQATFVLGATPSVVPNATNIDYTLTKASYEPLVQSEADNLNDSGACGYTNWAVNVVNDVTGKQCYDDQAPVAAGRLGFDVVSLQGGKLIFGLGPAAIEGTNPTGSADGSTAAKRPQSLNPASGLTRAP